MKRFVLILAVLFLCTVTSKAQNAYVLNAHSKVEPMEKAYTSGFKITGKSMLSLYGAKMTTSIVFDGKSAQLALPKGANYFYIIWPKQYSIKQWKLAPLKKGKKNTRLLPYFKSGLYSGNETNIEEIDMTVEKIADEIYRLSPSKVLDKGEYALFWIENGAPAQCFDFRIDSSISPALDVPANDDIIAMFKESLNKVNATDANSESELLAGSRQALSDVDVDIPITKKSAQNTFALIISNENYKQVENVPFALNDGKVFKQYLKLCIGLPESHIVHIEDASLSDIKFALNRINEFAEAFEGDAKVIVHYSGHGIPDERNSEGYILPADGYSSDPSTAFKLSDLYNTLGNIKAKSVTMFLDACFSGAKRDGGMLASARGVVLMARPAEPTGNLVVISAAQGDQTAFPYKDKEHGMMTYFLLKKLQETKGDVNLGELSDYITTNVKRTSLVENGKSQVPSVSFDSNNSNWRKQSFR